MKYLIVLLFFMSMLACEESVSKAQTITKEINPAAIGFNLEGSDAKAIAIADQVVEASGGRAAWDNTDYFQWRFFGNRLHTWNKSTGDLIIESEKDSFVYHMNLETMEGIVVMKGDTLGTLESKGAQLQKGKEFWINDSYWIFLPFKLKDSGVTLKYKGEGTSGEGVASELLELTFNDVGVTPDNKYIVYVDKETHLINQWDFYSNYEDTEAQFSTPWADYKDYNGLKLASSRGGNRGMQDMAVGEDLAKKWSK